jgi:3-oxoacyl-[acyl-carrier-protein] synthase-3
MSLKILGTGKALPNLPVTNEELARIVDTNDEWITTRTGIKSRYICREETLTELCEQASLSALQKAKLPPSEIDMVICSTIGGDYVTPSLACSVLEKLGLSCPAFDINAACTGFIYALDTADAYIASGKANTILIISAEMMSGHVDWNDRATCVLFGDGAGACVVTRGDSLNYINLTADGDTKILNLPSGNGNCPFREHRDLGHLHMSGQEVFKFAVSMIESQTKLALDNLGLAADDIDYYIFHQANKRIIDSARMKLKQPEEKFPINIDRYGNISSATIPILLDEMLDNGLIQKGTRLLMTAFGAGLTTGICVMTWE